MRLKLGETWSRRSGGLRETVPDRAPCVQVYRSHTVHKLLSISSSCSDGRFSTIWL